MVLFRKQIWIVIQLSVIPKWNPLHVLKVFKHYSCYSIYGFYVCFVDRCLSFVLFLLAILLSVLLRYTDSDYPFGIFSDYFSYIKPHRWMPCSSVVDRGQSKIYKTGICSISSKHRASRSKSKE
jgi:hypothetical protein